MPHFDRLRTVRWLSVLTVCLSVTPLTAQQDPCLVRTIPLTILDNAGKPVSVPVPDTLSGRLDGKPVEILSTKVDRRPRRVVILLDASGSMTHIQVKWTAQLMLADHAARTVSRWGQVALAVFDTHISETVGFEQGSAAIASRLPEIFNSYPVRKRTPSERGTALLDSIVQSVDLFHLDGPGDIIYAITDGSDNLSNAPPQQVVESLSRSGARLFAFLLEDAKHRIWEFGRDETGDRYGADQLLKIVKMTGGMAVGAGLTERQIEDWELPIPKDRAGKIDQQVLHEMAHLLYEGMANFYQVQVKLPMALDKPQSWKLRFDPGKDVPPGKVSTYYPTTLRPCTEPKGAHQP